MSAPDWLYSRRVNYRHAYHAGNVADVMKHVVVSRILCHLLRKPAPFRFVDTHAGIGLYDLGAAEAMRTGEWQDGIGLMREPFPEEVELLLAPWRDVLSAVRARHGADAYPGSPALAREMLRPGDRAIFVEKHPQDHASLAARFRRATNAKVLHLDGWTALGSVIPPKERRGLVLIDPPFEEPGEFARCAERLAGAVRRWPSGVYALWYPIKTMDDPAKLADAVSGMIAAPTLRLELMVAPVEGTRLAGSGMLVVNPPWTLAGEAERLLPALAGRLGKPGAFLSQELVQEGA